MKNNKNQISQKVILPLLIFTLIISGCFNKNEIKVKSPSKNIALLIELNKDKGNALFYSIKENNKQIVKASPLGLELKKTGVLAKNLEITSISKKSINKEWRPVYGEKNRFTNHYNEVVLQLRETVPPNRSMVVTFRVYNEGVALRYTVNTTGEVTITKELTGFKFPSDNFAWVTYQPQGEYKKIPLSKIEKKCEGPLVIETNSNTVAIGEAALVNHSKIKFHTAAPDSLTIVCSMAGEATYNSTFSTPWRYILIGNSPGKILENTAFILNLNEPNQIKNTDWIKPGKVIREVTLTTKGAKACIDFAARHNLQYVEFDAGWYGLEYDNASDATTVTVDPNRSPGPLDLHEAIRYGKQNNVGIILYVNGRAMINQLDEILPLYNSWGIKGVKYGFVNVGPQKWTQWLHEAVRKAAKYKLMVDIHDNYRPTGYSRTYPNLMTQEGIRGDEESPSVEHSIITLFTRLIAGAADNTNCYLAERVSTKMGGKTGQMAKSVMLYSPWQFLYWYDRPANSPQKKGGAGNTKGLLYEEEALSFYDALPTVWDDTKVLEGEIGEFATVARKSGNNWFVGSLAANKPRQLNLPLTFLEKGENYEATIYSQNRSNLENNTVQIAKMPVTSETVFSKKLETNSGIALIIRKK